MGKETGILINHDIDELSIIPVMDSQGRILRGFDIGNATQQNIGIIVKSQPGEIKEFPLLGVGIDNSLLEQDALFFKHKIRQQLEIDGLRVSRLEIKGQTIELEANYQ